MDEFEAKQAEVVGRNFAVKHATDDEEAYRVGRLLEDIAGRIIKAEDDAATAADLAESMEEERDNIQSRNEELEAAFKTLGDLGAKLVQLAANAKKPDPGEIPFDASAFEAKAVPR